MVTVKKTNQATAGLPVPAKKKPKTKKLTKSELHRRQWSGDNLAKASGSVMTASMNALKTLHPADAITPISNADTLVIGVPVPSFAVEYLIQNTCWPLERVSQVVGIHGTSKSGFTTEFGRWVRRFCSGIGTLFETESKFSADWAMSILGWDDPNAMGLVPCDSVNDWQGKLQWMINYVKRSMTGTKQEPGSGRVYPWLGVVDSVMGKASQETQDNIEKKGFAGRARPEEARMITGFLRKLPRDLTGWPFHVMVVNHLKPDKDQTTGAIIRNKSGGRGLDFMETFEIEFSAQQNKRIRLKNREGTRLFMSCKKNSLGVTDRKIPIEVTWTTEDVYDAAIGQEAHRQVTTWDWFGASIKLLTMLPVLDEAKASAVKAICNIQTREGKVTCKELGIKEPVSFTDAGMVLQETPAVLWELRKLFGVKIREAFKPGVDYRTQRKQEKERMAKRAGRKQEFKEITEEIRSEGLPTKPEYTEDDIEEE